MTAQRNGWGELNDFVGILHVIDASFRNTEDTANFWPQPNPSRDRQGRKHIIGVRWKRHAPRVVVALLARVDLGPVLDPSRRVVSLFIGSLILAAPID